MLTTLKPRWADLEKLFECKKKCLEQVFFLGDSIQVILIPYKLITGIFFQSTFQLHQGMEGGGGTVHRGLGSETLVL